MNTARKIINELGRASVGEAVGLGEKSISRAAVDGSFPASWYAALKKLCDQNGIECPVSAFNMRQSPKQNNSEAA
jgi:sialic acid synthase SpsE